MGDQLRGHHVLQRDGVVKSVGDDGVARAVVMGGRQKRGDVGKDSLAELQRVGRGRKAGQGDITEIGLEAKRK